MANPQRLSKEAQSIYNGFKRMHGLGEIFEVPRGKSYFLDLYITELGEAHYIDVTPLYETWEVYVIPECLRNTTASEVQDG